MRQHFFRFSVLLVPLFFVFSCQDNPTALNESVTVPESSLQANDHIEKATEELTSGKIVTADRASGNLSVINSMNDELMKTIELPTAANPNQPMYVVYDHRGKTVFVGDRGNDRVVAFDSHDFSVKGEIPAGSGVFHMWADPRGKQLWVNNDIDKTISVLDPQTLSVITTIDMPTDLKDMGGKPHDVIVDPLGQYAFVSFLGFSGSHDYVVKYNTHSFREMGRVAVGKDPHLSLTQKNNELYVPCQGSDAVFLINRATMKVKEVIRIPGAHGAGMALNGKTFYTTNLPNGGNSGLWAIDVRTNQVLGNVDTPYAVPHNIALTPNGKKIYVTHSGGSSNKVSVYTVSRRHAVPRYSGEITVGFNPFGLAFVK